MKWRDGPEPVRMQRIAIVAPWSRLRQALVLVADLGTVELDAAADRGATQRQGTAQHVLEGVRGDAPVTPRLSSTPVDLATLADAGRVDLIAGEAEVEAVCEAAVVRGEVAAVAGWTPVHCIAPLRQLLESEGAAVCELALPRGVDPPTQLRTGGRVRRSFAPLVDTYATVPYVDLDPTMLAGAAYVVMFAMMFGDVGHGALLVLVGLLLRRGRPAALAAAQRVWPFVVAAGGAAMAFGALYGEFFGPTGVVPVLWLRPLDQPVTLLGVALAAGAVLLSGAYGLGIVNRWREGGWALALVSASGMAGAAIFAGAGVLVLGLVTDAPLLVAAGTALAATGVVLCYVGFLASAGGGAAGAAQAAVELFDTTLRLGTNVVSFARLAAFGLTHAAVGLVVWQLTSGLWASGGALIAVAVLAFAVGNALAFSLEALIAGVQALRLSYYELFSRVFSGEGRAFRPWHVPMEARAQAPGAGGTEQPVDSASTFVTESAGAVR